MFDLFVVSRAAQRQVQQQFEPDKRARTAPRTAESRNAEPRRKPRGFGFVPALRLSQHR